MAQPPTCSLTPTQVHNALKQWHGDSTSGSSLSHLYLYRVALRDTMTGNPRQATNQLLVRALEEMRAVSEQDAQLLQLRFSDLRPVNTLANYFNVAESTLYAMQRRAIARLADTLRIMEHAARRAQHERLLQRLEPPTYVELIGVDDTLTHVLETLVTKDAHWLVALEGMGGIGKTALADRVTRQIIEENHFDEVGWIRARHHRSEMEGRVPRGAQPALTGEALVEGLARQFIPGLISTHRYSSKELLGRVRTRLKESSHLVVIDNAVLDNAVLDNVETQADSGSLLPVLRDLVKPSKFLLTTRHSLRGVPLIHHVSVPELSQEDAVTLLRQEARLRNVPILANSKDQVLHAIYDVVGGNPLALRLVVGQMHIYALDQILDDLRNAQGEPVENLYRFTYSRA